MYKLYNDYFLFVPTDKTLLFIGSSFLVTDGFMAFKYGDEDREESPAVDCIEQYYKHSGNRKNKKDV